MTGRKIGYAILLGLLWLQMVLYSYPVTAVLFYVFLGFPAVWWIIFRISLWGMELDSNLPKCVVTQGETVQAEIVVRKANSLPAGCIKVRLIYRNATEKAWNMYKMNIIVNHRQQSSCIDLCAEHSGNIELCVKKARISDVLGLFSHNCIRKQTENRQTVISVLPKTHALEHSAVRENPYVMVESDIYSDTASGDDPSEIHDIREYQAGDRINRIHWKMSAKENRLMVKELGLPLDCSVLLLIENGHAASAKEQMLAQDAVREAAFSISMDLALKGQIHLAAWYNERSNKIERRMIRCPEDYYEVAGELLSSGREPKGFSFPEAYFAEFEKEQYTNILYISAAGLSQETIELLERRRKSAWVRIGAVSAQEEEIVHLYIPDGMTACRIEPGQVEAGLADLVYREGGASWQESM